MTQLTELRLQPAVKRKHKELIMKIPKKFAPLLFAVCMALIFPFVVTFFIVLLNVGFSHDFLFRWAKSYAVTVVIALPTILLISPLIRKFVGKITG
jgi:hypothetical protein